MKKKHEVKQPSKPISWRDVRPYPQLPLVLEEGFAVRDYQSYNIPGFRLGDGVRKNGETWKEFAESFNKASKEHYERQQKQRQQEHVQREAAIATPEKTVKPSPRFQAATSVSSVTSPPLFEPTPGSYLAYLINELQGHRTNEDVRLLLSILTKMAEANYPDEFIARLAHGSHNAIIHNALIETKFNIDGELPAAQSIELFLKALRKDQHSTLYSLELLRSEPEQASSKTYLAHLISKLKNQSTDEADFLLSILTKKVEANYPPAVFTRLTSDPCASVINEALIGTKFNLEGTLPPTESTTCFLQALKRDKPLTLSSLQLSRNEISNEAAPTSQSSSAAFFGFNTTPAANSSKPSNSSF